MRNVIKCLKEEGEEGLTPFFEREHFDWKLRKHVRNMVSTADRLNFKKDVIQRRQQRELNERTAQKTAEQGMQDRQALLELLGQVNQSVPAASGTIGTRAGACDGTFGEASSFCWGASCGRRGTRAGSIS